MNSHVSIEYYSYSRPLWSTSLSPRYVLLLSSPNLTTSKSLAIGTKINGTYASLVVACQHRNRLPSGYAPNMDHRCLADLKEHVKTE